MIFLVKEYSLLVSPGNIPSLYVRKSKSHSCLHEPDETTESKSWMGSTLTYLPHLKIEETFLEPGNVSLKMPGIHVAFLTLLISCVTMDAWKHSSPH